MSVAQLKQRRGRLLASLTRVRRRAFVLIDSRGSRTRLVSIIPELDQALEHLEEVTDSLVSSLTSEDEVAQVRAYQAEAEKQHEEAVARIEAYLKERKDDLASVASKCTSKSAASGASAASRGAEIEARVKHLELEQLQQRLETEKEEHQIQQKMKLQEAKDAHAAAELRAQLARAAEDDLSWERRNDFCDEAKICEVQTPQPNLTGRGGQLPSDSAGNPAQPNVPPAVPTSYSPAASGDTQGVFCAATHGIPRLTLPKFSGEPGEWPKWSALFKTLVGNQTALTLTEKMIHLQASVTGLAQNTISGMLFDGGLYEEAMRALEDRFGRQDDVVYANLQKIFSCPTPSHLDPVGLEHFHASVHCAVTIFQNLGYVGDLSSFGNLRRVVEKLPPELKQDWGEYILDLEKRPSLVDFDVWLQRKVRVALNYAAVSSQSKKHMKESKPKPVQRAAQRTALTVTAKVTPDPCVCCGEKHELTACPTFLQKTVDERAHLIATSRCCFYCLKKGHGVRRCFSAKVCGIQDCKMRHHKLLHGSQRVRKVQETGAPEGQRIVASASLGDGQRTTLLQVVPVTIVGPNKAIEVCALLDPGSQTTLVSEHVMKDLGLQGTEQRLRLQNVEGCGPQQISRKTQLELCATSGSCARIFVPEAFSVRDINVRVPQVQRRPEWKHIEELPLPDCAGRRVDLLIGANVLEAVLQLEIRTGNPGDPVAIRTAFGWTLTGSVGELVPGQVRSVMFVNHMTEESSLCAELQNWWATESFGCKYEGQSSRSQEDIRAEEMLQRTKKTSDGHYEVELLWKQAEPMMPDNKKMAERRLQSLEKSLARNPSRAEAYEEALMGYVAKGHARKVLPVEQSQPTKKRWMLPHHAVVNPNKTKIRVVFDAAARFAGTSLNEALLTGPDLLQNLTGVLIRFREERVALVADIEQMFHQVRVREDDQPALSFLWRNMDKSRPPDLYQMMVVIFGARCSPTLANYALRRTAEDHADDTEESRTVAAVVKNNFYMDDMLVSVPDIQKATKMRQDVADLVKKGGFRLTKWSSNKPEVLEDVPDGEMSSSGLDLARLGQGAQRALGCMWKPGTDVLGVKVSDMDVPATKRGVLSRLSMVFDPLGFVSPFVLRAKVLVQRLWALKRTWDEPLTGRELEAWEKWLSDLPCLEEIEIPRCYKSGVPENVLPVRSELHVFCDASEVAFGTAAYLRTSFTDGTHSTSLIMSRTRLAPLKCMTIVRLELQAAVLGARLADRIRRELSCQIDEICLWTDSAVVLQFLQNESRRFHTFVCNRVAEIHDLSATEQWRHIPSECNPADVCSRGMSGTKLKACSLWWSGPEFLVQDRGEWPVKQVGSALDAENPEVKASSEAVFATHACEPQLLDPCHHSSWLRYKRTVAWIIRFSKNARLKEDSGQRVEGPLTASELEDAEEFILKEAQRLTLSAELSAISKGCPLPTGSRLQHLSPYVDGRGLLRVGGRLNKAPLPETCRNPIILTESEITRLIISDAHQRVLHSGLEHTLSEVRLSYWIPKARSVVKKVLHRCAPCRNRRVLPQAPKMADLPDSRFDTSRPFACVGLDYLGPLSVRRFRKTEKRYVLLVTCLATRALHLELVTSLDTDGFLMALRRFIARRGKPKLIMSDNGTNLVAGERELRTCLREWNQDQIVNELSQKQIEWRFNPPTAHHMGGIWERLVASVKRALRMVLGTQCPAEDVLHTVLLEVEFILNSRPLTYVSSDISDAEPLTPNHFIMGYPEAALPPGRFTTGDTWGRGKWRQSQALANQLWQRWQKEYLPLLIGRKKWQRQKRDLQVGDVVLLVEESSPRGYWPLARVTEVVPSADGTVRTVQVKTAAGSKYLRPANKVCYLESVPVKL